MTFDHWFQEKSLPAGWFHFDPAHEARVCNRLGIERSGKVITCSGPHRLIDLVPIVRRCIQVDGLCVIKGANVDLAEFEQFTRYFCDIFHREPWRTNLPGADDFTQFVDAGVHPVLPHGEHLWMPDPPDLIFMYCVKPAEVGGETSLIDGARIIHELPERSSTFFREAKVVWKLHIEIGSAMSMFGCETQETFEQLCKRKSSRVADDESLEWKIENGFFEFRYVQPAYRQTRWGKRALAGFIANERLVEHYHNRPDSRAVKLRLADGSPFPLDKALEIQALCPMISAYIPLEAKDLLIVDNTRYLHGRNGFIGDRQVCVRYGTASF
jgi:hypothetical protein